MAEQELQNNELPLGTVGQRLRNAREAAGLSLDDISARTKIAERHLVAIEEDRFADLASRTYAVGFSRAYARTVGLDEKAITGAVREQLAAEEEHWPKPQSDSFEPGDPARVPPARLAWTAGLGALAVLVLLFIFWRSFLNPAGSLPDLTRDDPPAATATRKAVEAAQPASETADGPVVITALADGVWVKFSDAGGNQLFQKELALGESYTVPGDAEDPRISTARPDALKVTVGGRPVPKLGDAPGTIRDMPVTAAALLARAPEAAETPTPRSVVTPAATPSPTRSPRPVPTASATAAPPRPASSPTPRATLRPAVPKPGPTATATPKPVASPRPAASASPAPASGSAQPASTAPASVRPVAELRSMSAEIPPPSGQTSTDSE